MATPGMKFMQLQQAQQLFIHFAAMQRCGYMACVLHFVHDFKKCQSHNAYSYVATFFSFLTLPQNFQSHVTQLQACDMRLKRKKED